MRILILAAALAVASSAAANPLVRKTAIEPPPQISLQRVRIECLDASLGGSCPSPLEACKAQCDDEFDYDTLRCMAGAGGILLEQRAICHAKAAGIYVLCLKNCGDIY